MDQTNCLQQDDIEEYILGRANDDRIEDIGNHLADCLRCRAIADELESSASDPLMDVLHGPEPDDNFPSERECQQALSRARKLIDTQPPPSDTGNDKNLDEELPADQHLGEYLILERLGGHMGAVYKARHTALDRFVAVKVLPARALGDEQAVARFQSEMKAVGRLEHPHIVRAYDAREIDGKHVLVMEFVEGENLSELLRTRGRLLVADACEIIRQAAVGLQYVHEKGLVHRDVKPSNLMLTPQGEVKILDLGLAHFHAGRPGTGVTISAGNIVGTPAYMAPEQITGSHQVDIRADVYGLGCTLYKLLSNRAPYEGPEYESTSSILAGHLHKSIPPIKKSQPEVPEALVAILDRMLAKAPSDRFETPGQLATALEPFTSGCDLRALKEGDESRRQSVKKHRLPDPQPSHPSSGLWKLVVSAAVLILLILGGKWVYEHGNLTPTFAVHVDVDHPDRIYRGPPAGPDGRGELVQVKITSEQEGYVYVIHRSADGKLSMLYPNKIQKNNRISAKEEVRVPHPDANFQLRVGPPYGEEQIQAVVSLVPRKPEDFGVESLTDADVTPLQPADVKDVFVELKKKPTGWAEDIVRITTRPGEPQEPARDESQQGTDDDADEADPPASDPVTPSPGVALDEVPVETSGEQLENVSEEVPEETPAMPTDEGAEEAPAESPAEVIPERAAEPAGDEPNWLDTPNAKQTFAVHVEVDHPTGIYRGPPAGPDGRGELMHVKVTSEKEGYLYLIYQSADGELSMLFPNTMQKDNKIVANQQIGVPHPDAEFQLRVGPPYGKELLKAVVSLVPLKPEDFGVESLTDAHATPLEPNDVKGVFVELKEEPKNWAEGHVRTTTLAGSMPQR